MYYIPLQKNKVAFDINKQNYNAHITRICYFCKTDLFKELQNIVLITKLILYVNSYDKQYTILQRFISDTSVNLHVLSTVI